MTPAPMPIAERLKAMALISKVLHDSMIWVPCEDSNSDACNVRDAQQALARLIAITEAEATTYAGAEFADKTAEAIVAALASDPSTRRAEQEGRRAGLRGTINCRMPDDCDFPDCGVRPRPSQAPDPTTLRLATVARIAGDPWLREQIPDEDDRHAIARRVYEKMEQGR